MLPGSLVSFLVPFSDNFILFILLQLHVLKLSKYFCSNFLIVLIYKPYNAMLQI